MYREEIKIISLFLRSSESCLAEILETGASYALTEEDIDGIRHDIATFKRILDALNTDTMFLLSDSVLFIYEMCVSSYRQEREIIQWQ